MKLGIFIGRMQPLHLGHQRVIEKSLEDNDLTLIILGSGGVQDSKSNLFSDEQRKDFLKIFLKKKTRCKVLLLKDTESDLQWVKNLKLLIENTGNQYMQDTLKRLLGGTNISNEDLSSENQFFQDSVEQVNFYGGDLENDYAIQAVKKNEKILKYKKITYVELSREELVAYHNGDEIFISSTRVRDELKRKNFALLEKMLNRRILATIKKI